MPFDETSWRLPKVKVQLYDEEFPSSFEQAEGLYDPSLEKDACGVGFIVHIDGSTSHQVLRDAEKLSRR